MPHKRSRIVLTGGPGAGKTELENMGDADNAAIVLCDRGTVDGAAYWPGRKGSKDDRDPPRGDAGLLQGGAL